MNGKGFGFLFQIFHFHLNCKAIKCKAIKNKNILHQFYTINGIVRVKLVEHGPVKTVTHISDLEELFPDISIDGL